jgi:hypothetical protein
MAGKLVQVATNTVTSAVASVTLTGIDSDDVYMVACNNIFFDTNDDMRIRFTVSGSADTSSNYDYAHKAMYSNVTFGNTAITNQSNLDTNQSTGTSSDFQINTIMYLYNFNNSSEYSFVTYENAHRNTSQSRTALFAGGGVLTVAQATDGVHFYLNSGNNFANGTFTLYKVV